MFLIILIGFLFSSCYTIYLFCKHRFLFWSRKGVDYLNPTLPFGDMKRLWKGVPATVHFCEFYNIFKGRGRKHGGIFQFFEPTYVPVDPEYIKNILIRDFQHFADRGIYYNEKNQPIMRNLFFMEGNDWRNMRAKLSSSYTSGKMKIMFNTMLDCTVALVKRVGELTEGDDIVDIKDISARFTTDVIGSCAFGIECNSFESPNSEFRMYGKKLFGENVIKTMKGLFRTVFPKFSKRLGLVVFEKDVVEFFTNAVTETYYCRRQNNIQRNDFMRLLIELKDKENDPHRKDFAFTMNDVIAEAFIFFIAGFDTSATTLTFALFEMANNSKIQDKVREEIDYVIKKYDGNITYEAINDMKYMDKVVQETLRKYPPVALINRICTETYEIPYTDVVLEKGTHVGISVLGLHRDPEYYPDPEKFDPERFSEENKGKIVPGTYMPFGDGPRVCMGLRFGLLQVKIGLVTLLKNFEFNVNPRTKMPLEIALGFVMTVKGGVWLNSRRCPRIVGAI